MHYPLLAVVLGLFLCGCGGSSDGQAFNGGSNADDSPTTPGSPPVTVSDAFTGSGGYRLEPEQVDAARFLMQATFGPTEQSIAAFVNGGGAAAWLDRQMALPTSLTLPYTRANSNGSGRQARHEIWWNNVLDGEDQLRQRVAFALSEIFVVSDNDYTLGNAQWGMADYYDMLARNAFGNYRNLLEQVTLHPVMGVYLSMVRNEKANLAENIRPDENYAREVMQLLSIGLYQLDEAGRPVPAGNPQPAYTQRDVEELARVFTGWNYGTASNWTSTNQTGESYLQPMVPVEQWHDADAKTLVGGTVIPGGLSAADDMKMALDTLYFHPNVGPFISRQLIQRLVTSNPSPDYVRRVARVFNNDTDGQRGNLAAVVRAILLDEEARGDALSNPQFGKLREPLIKLAHVWRALSATPGPQAEGIHRTALFPLYRLEEMTGQAVMKSQSVFNFFKPDNPLPGSDDQVSPELQIMTEANIAATHNNYHHHVYRFHDRANLNDDNPRVTLMALEPLADMAADPLDLIRWFDLVLFAGTMPEIVASELYDYMNTLENNDAGRFARAQDSLFILLSSPALNVQR